jgi:two-component system, cell cycle response regulator
MIKLHRVSMIGFGTFERASLESFLRLAEQRARRALASGQTAAAMVYERTEDPAACDVVLVNADAVDALAKARAYAARSVSIGTAPLAGGLAHVPRPINMLALLELLNNVAARDFQPLTAPPAVHPLTAERSTKGVASSLPPVTEPPESSDLPEQADHILVVDDSDVALNFMAKCLGRYGFNVHLARSGDDAIRLVAEVNVAIVFMDVNMPGLDGYQTCKVIKRRAYPRGRKAPIVAMLTSRGGMVDKMRGTLSGCDMYLTKPLRQDDLMKVIGERMPGRKLQVTSAY